MRGVGSLVSLLALALFTAFLAISLPPALSRSLDFIKLALRLRGEPVLDQRVRVWGASYTVAIEEIRRIIPRDAAYVIVESEASPAGAPLWVRFDLAPRRAVFLGQMAKLGSPQRARRRIPRTVDWVVIAHDLRAPEVMARSRFLHLLEERR